MTPRASKIPSMQRVKLTLIPGLQFRVRNENLTLIPQPKHILWVLKRTVSIRRFFEVPKTYVKIDV